MLAEILTGVFSAVTMGYLAARHNHIKKSVQVEEPATVTTISREARDQWTNQRQK